MSRGVKDLRELICVSRLSMRSSSSEDEEEETTEEDVQSTPATPTTTDDDQVVDPMIAVNKDSRLSSGSSVRTVGSDSGIGTNGVSPVCAGLETVSSSQTPHKKKKKKTKKRKSSALPKAGPPIFESLPEGDVPLLRGSRCELPPLCATERTQQTSSASSVTFVAVNFDHLMLHIDAGVVSDCLQRSNSVIQELCAWAHSGENLVHFAHFWLTEFSLEQRKTIYSLEYGVVVDELTLAFRGGLDAGAVTRTDLNRLVQAILREYPGRLLSLRGPVIFLNHLDILTSERSDDYRRLLTDVKLSTRNRTYAQWFLAIRAFGLVSVWSAVVNFYRQLVDRGEVRLPRPMTSRVRTTGSKERVWQTRLVQAMNYSYITVLDHIFQNGKISPSQFRDSEKRSVVFLAVSLRNVQVLSYLIRQVHPPVDVNSPADTGNTPLHAAVCTGSLDLVRILIEHGKAQIDPTNPQCDDTTPLHMAVIYGHSPIVKYLLDHGANPKLKTKDKDALAMAKDFGHTYIAELLYRWTEGQLTAGASSLKLS